MVITERIIVSVSILWAIGFLLAQVLSSRGNRRDFSVPAGSPIQGVIYNFTWAMLPKHKESIRLHPGPFTIGLLMHIGVFIGLALVLVALFVPQITIPATFAFSIVLGIGLTSAVYLFWKRVFSKLLKSMSSPDDYISILLVVDFLFATLLHVLSFINSGVFLIHASILFFYLPLGKLKHALFFFIARADYGSRLGYRGTYPAKSGGKD
jgi:nitrate reductase gamma subunit